MSWDYGWNAQSALLPEKKVEIKVGDKGNQNIKAAMLLIKEKTKNQPQIKGAYYKPTVNKEPKKNKGVEERIKRDEETYEFIRMKDDKSFAVIKEKLEKKEKLYEESEINAKNHSEFLVDFVEKELSKEDEELEQLKKEFYEGRLKEIIAQQNRIHEGEETTGIHDYMRENLAWEKEVLQELNGETIGINGKSKVAQSFDRKLTEEEKQALNKVINERMREKQRVEDMKKQRQEEEIERIRKLKKLNILSDSEEENEKQ